MDTIPKALFLAMTLLALLLTACGPAQLPATPAPTMAPTREATIAPTAMPPTDAPARLEVFTQAQHGYQVSVPAGYVILQELPDEVVILAPEGTEGHRQRAMILVTAADGRTVEQIVEELKATDLTAVAAQVPTALTLDGEPALVFERVPSQDLMRIVYVVHEDRLYKIMFVPDDEAAGEAYKQMEEVYAAFTGSFRFIPVQSAAPARPTGGKLVAEMDVFVPLLRQALAERNRDGLQSMMGEGFLMQTWGQTEGQEWISPGVAVERILSESVPEGAQPVLDTDDPAIAQWFSEMPTLVEGEELTPVHVSGWGPQGQDEAVLLIARRANGSLYWAGVVTAVGGFE